MTNYPIIDLHCDLLDYLQYDPKRTPYDTVVPCAVPHMRQGGIRCQIMAIFTETGDSSLSKGMAQYQLFKELSTRYPDTFRLHSSSDPLILEDAHAPIAIQLAIENASSVCSEACTLQQCIDRLDKICLEGCKPLYISLTWNGENRFGGGAHTDIGLKDEGRRLVDWMSANGVAIDFSHTSDVLAHDILRHIDTQQLPIRMLASHSNSRSVWDAVRNLPDDLLKELLKRGGIIGINFVRYFIGNSAKEGFPAHVQKIVDFGGQNQICLGADFFYASDAPLSIRKTPEELFFPGYDTSASYPQFLQMMSTELGWDAATVRQIAYGNAQSFVRAPREK